METPLSLSLILSFSSFLVLFLFVGAIASRFNKSTEQDYLLGSRTFGRWMIALSAGATGNSGFIIIGAVGLGYTQGVNAFSIWIGFFIGELIFWSYFATPISKITEKSKAETVSELLTYKLNSKAAKKVRSFVSLLIFIFVGAYIVAQLSGSAKILTSFGIETTSGIFISLFAILAYCTTGGLRASIWTDIVQAIVMIFMSVGVMSYAVYEIGGFVELKNNLTAIDPNLLLLSNNNTLFSLFATILSFAIMGMCFGLSQPHMTVRVMAGSSPEEVKKAKWIYLAFIYGTGISMTLFGICCRLLLPEIGDPEASLPTFAIENFSPVIIGIVLAGMFSTIASSADSQILACASAISKDLSPKFAKKMTSLLGIRYQQIATVLTGLIAAFATIYISSSVFELVVFSISVLSASIGVAMLINVLDRPTSATCLTASMLTGVYVALTWKILSYSEVINEIVPGFISALIVHEVLSYILVRNKKEKNFNREKLIAMQKREEAKGRSKRTANL